MADEFTVERIEKAYMTPIRTVLAVDDEFRPYGADEPGPSHLRAKALWQACRNRGLLCDVDDGGCLVAGELPPYLLKSDLVILDYAGQHLSRIGVDFVNLPKAPDPKPKAKPTSAR